ncbi:hypothetical protein F5B22DRAFT_650410 [Xylaria bambusicola]|uniref:uncharacterized protein n=1 Tax=Xylaria bambusicola TaxID=326684 RepID=UPI0020087DFC|nr:uncharacterized protein F5B22DRAFT_650410 [Xylaria bambusicola]KAI0506762.1 hypothetical protein F5B22DRAFT_650410 [Xylaria bambusicola]
MAGKKNSNSKSKGDNKSSADGDKGGSKLKGGQKIDVRHILCAKHSRKEEALAEIQRLTRGEPKEGAPANASEPVGKMDPKTKTKAPTQAIFIHVAKQFSEDKAAQGGALGVKTKGSLHPEFERVAYSLQPTENGIVHIGEAKTDFGYHLIVVDKRL